MRRDPSIPLSRAMEEALLGESRRRPFRYSSNPFVSPRPAARRSSPIIAASRARPAAPDLFVIIGAPPGRELTDRSALLTVWSI
jgi:hypothetical protein